MPPHQTITNLGAVKAQSVAYDNTKAAIAIPQVSTADTFTTLNATQTLTNKTLTTPVIASLKQASNGGTINMPIVASDETATLATIDTNQTITGTKTLVGPILRGGKGIGEISVPDVNEDTVMATALDIASLQSTLTTLQSSVASATDIDRLKLVLSNLLTYLQNWANVGNLNMNDIIEQTDAMNYLGLQAPPS